MLIAYEQQQYVAEAIRGAFSQTYKPLEIILSDDGSADATFETMQKMVAEYRGPHRVRLNRNEKNLGLGGHVDHLMGLAHGELVVVAAGDDISVPERVERLWQSYVDSGGRAMSVYSSLRVIDEHGDKHEIVHRPPGEAATDIEAYLVTGGVCGCSHAWHRRTFDIFGPMLPGTVYEDKVIPFRSILLGEIRYIDEPLVLYRRHSQSITGPRACPSTDLDAVAQVVKRQNRRLITLKNYERDLLHENDAIRVDADVRKRLAASVHRRIRRMELEIAFNEGAFRDRVRVIRQGVSAHLGLPRIAKWCVQLVYPYHLHRARRKLRKDPAGS